MKKTASAWFDGCFGLGPHAAGQAFRSGLLQSGGIDHGEVDIAESALPSRRLSRVTPGLLSTSASRRPTNLLKRVDLPTLGRPAMMATVNGTQ